MPRFRSKFEQRLAVAMKRAGVIFTYESMRIKYVKNHHYTPDFVLDNGVILEAKGRFMSSDRAKHLLVKAQHPDLDIRFVFMRASNTLTSGARQPMGIGVTRMVSLGVRSPFPVRGLTNKNEN